MTLSHLTDTTSPIRIPFTSFVDFCIRRDTESQIAKASAPDTLGN
mgnify:FL=1